MTTVAVIVLVVLVIVAAALGGAIFVAVRQQRGGSLRAPAIDPFTVGEPWRHLVRSAQRAQTRYRDTARALRPGPTRDRLGDIGRQVDDAVQECWRIARRGDEVRIALNTMNIGATRSQLAAEHDEQRAASLRARVATYERVAATGADTEQRLRLLVARLEETAARGAELSITTKGDATLDALGTEIADVVDQLEALRLAFDETDSRPELGTG